MGNGVVDGLGKVRLIHGGCYEVLPVGFSQSVHLDIELGLVGKTVVRSGGVLVAFHVFAVPLDGAGSEEFPGGVDQIEVAIFDVREEGWVE